MIKQKPLQIFSKDADMGIDVVKSPVKLTILEMLRSNDMEFDEIVKNTGKSKRGNFAPRWRKVEEDESERMNI